MEKKQKKEITKIIILGVVLLLLSISIIFSDSISNGIKRLLSKADIQVGNDLLVHFIDVGQGDSIAVQFPNKEIMIIDAGPKDCQNKLEEYLKNNILQSNKDLVLDYVILTHPDSDHTGALSMMFSKFDVKNFYRPNIASKSESLEDFVATTSLVEYDEVIKLAKEEKDLKINLIDSVYDFCVGEVRVQIFPPVDVYATTNEMSCVIKVTYMNKSFLFTGDIQGDAENDMLERYGEYFDVDVLKVAHHGSYNSTSSEFVEKVTPKYGVICVGENFYGHPHLATIATLENFGVDILTTKEKSVVLFVVKIILEL
jgi:competence protein ComEC